MSQATQVQAQLTLSLPDELLQALAQAIVEVLLEQTGALPATDSPWLDFRSAMSYLGFSRNKLYKLTAARAIPFRKKQDGQGLLFHRDELNRWLEREYPSTGCAA
jgi:excisionase family DNA binding protein